MVESNGVHSAVPTQMADLKKSLEDVNNNTELTEDDVYTQLTNAESDLALAKDIGEALLAENIELREKYECLLEEHASQVEVSFVTCCGLYLELRKKKKMIFLKFVSQHHCSVYFVAV